MMDIYLYLDTAKWGDKTKTLLFFSYGMCDKLYT